MTTDTEIAGKARQLCEALREFAYTRKSDDRKRMLDLQQELLALCEPKEQDAGA